MNFPKVIDLLGGFLDQEDVGFALAGAFALHAYGLSRTTSDLDFVTETEVQDRLIKYLEAQGYETLYSSEGFSNHVSKDPELGRIDLIYVDAATSKKLFGAADSTFQVGSRKFSVPRAEHLAAMKVHAMKNDPGRRFQDMADIRFLLQLDGIDVEEIRDYFVDAGLEETFDEIKRSI